MHGSTCSFWANLRPCSLQLPAALREELVPAEAATTRDMGRLRWLGEFAGFPNYSTVSSRYSARKINALDQLQSWVIREHADEIRATLG